MINNESIEALKQAAPPSLVVAPKHLAMTNGWKLVPVRMTQEMKSILKEVAPKWNAESIYGNLLEVAPAAPAAQGDAKDTCVEMRALCGACGGTGDVHGLDGEWRGQCTCVHAWQQRVEKAEARVKEMEASRQVLQAHGGHPAPCARDCEAPSFANQVRERDARIAQLEAQLVRRRTPLSPETQQAIASARAAGQTVASTSGGLVFMNDGAEPDSGELDCPACGGSGHAGDAAAGSVA
ncbi:MAG: hypothetical protein I8H90_22685 [Burkholderiales bacterium]|nr:hypothetical protein [Burkholderiales bacterium]MBH2071722.1 hypothetical protein [Burkholderiales bacterium]